APGLPVTIRPPFEPCAKVVMARSISPASRTSATRKSTPREGAAAWMTPNWPGPPAMADCRKTVARVTWGAISLSNSSHFAAMLYSHKRNPVALPPGRARSENVAIDYRWAENKLYRVPELVTDLVRRQVVVIAAIGIRPALAAKAATTTIPVVFIVPEDPAKLGLVANLARPGGNLTGINWFAAEVTAKR